MISDKGILIKNVYYMLTYAFRVLQQTNYDEIASDEFDNIHDLFAAILSKGIAQQLKQGLHKEYITKHENLTTLRGKLNTQGAIKNKLQRMRLLACEYDEFSENNPFNHILKTASIILIKSPFVKNDRKTALKRSLLFFSEVNTIEPSSIRWNQLHYQKNNQNYKMLMNLCYFIIEGLLLSTDKGVYKMAGFLDDRKMAKLFERFVLEYYKCHYPELNAASSQVEWDLDDGMKAFLPIMQSDIMLRKAEKILIIDTKYYTHTMQTQYDKQTLHSNHLYQIFTYVKNQDKGGTGVVSGMLLYAKTEEVITPDAEFQMSGNQISVKTLDLNTNFQLLSKQLDRIVKREYGELEKRNVFRVR